MNIILKQIIDGNNRLFAFSISQIPTNAIFLKVFRKFDNEAEFSKALRLQNIKIQNQSAIFMDYEASLQNGNLTYRIDFFDKFSKKVISENKTISTKATAIETYEFLIQDPVDETLFLTVSGQATDTGFFQNRTFEQTRFFDKTFVNTLFLEPKNLKISFFTFTKADFEIVYKIIKSGVVFVKRKPDDLYFFPNTFFASVQAANKWSLGGTFRVRWEFDLTVADNLADFDVEKEYINWDSVAKVYPNVGSWEELADLGFTSWNALYENLITELS